VQGRRKRYQSAMLGRRTRVEKRGPSGAGMVGHGRLGVSLVLAEELSSARFRWWGDRSSSVKWPNVIEKVRKRGLNGDRPTINSGEADQAIDQLDFQINEPIEF
jgi:hypothetical protein